MLVRTHILARVVVRPREAAGELLAVYLESRTLTDPCVVVYSFLRDEWRVEPHRALMDRTRRADHHQAADVVQRLADMDEYVVVLQGAPRVREKVRR